MKRMYTKKDVVNQVNEAIEAGEIQAGSDIYLNNIRITGQVGPQSMNAFISFIHNEKIDTKDKLKSYIENYGVSITGSTKEIVACGNYADMEELIGGMILYIDKNLSITFLQELDMMMSYSYISASSFTYTFTNKKL